MADVLVIPDRLAGSIVVGCVAEGCKLFRPYAPNLAYVRIYEELRCAGWKRLPNPMAAAADEWGDTRKGVPRVDPHLCAEHANNVIYEDADSVVVRVEPPSER